MKRRALALKTGVGGFKPRTSPSSAFNPAVDIPGLVAWYDPADVSTVTLAGSNVTQINDKSVSGYHLVQATGANQPTYVTSALNGRNAINCVNPQFMVSGATALSAGAYTVINAFSMDNATVTNGRVFSFGFAGVPDGDNTAYGPSRRNLTNNEILAQGGSSNAFHSISLLTFAIHSSDRNASVVHSWLNGGDAKTGGAVSAALATANKIVMGNQITNTGAPGANYFVGLWFGTLVYSGVLSAADRQKAEGWLAWNYNAASTLDPAHPYRYAPPGMPFDPMQIPNLALYYDPSDFSTITKVGNVVSQINNKLGDGRDLVQATEALKPTHDTVGLNGLAVLDCRAQFLGNLSTFGIAVPAAYTYIGLVCPTWATTGNRGRFFVISNTGGDTGAGAFNTCFRQDSNLRLATGTLANQSFQTATTTDTWHSVTGIRGATTVDAWFDGTKNSQITGVTALSYGLARAVIGVDPANAFAFGTAYGYGKIGPQLVYLRALNDTEIAQLQGWLHWRYGLQSLLPAGHTYKNAPP